MRPSEPCPAAWEMLCLGTPHSSVGSGGGHTAVLFVTGVIYAPKFTSLKRKSNKSDNRTDADRDHATWASQPRRHLPRRGLCGKREKPAPRRLCPVLTAGRDRVVQVQGHGLWLTRGLRWTQLRPAHGRCLQSGKPQGASQSPHPASVAAQLGHRGPYGAHRWLCWSVPQLRGFLRKRSRTQSRGLEAVTGPRACPKCSVQHLPNNK